MAWVKNEQRQALAGANDIAITFSVADAASPDAGELIASVHLGGITASLVVRDIGSLSGAQRTALRSVLTEIRDVALVAAGFVDV